MYRYRIYGIKQRDSYRFCLQKGNISFGWQDVLNILTPNIHILEYLVSNFLGIEFQENMIDSDWIEYENKASTYSD